MKTKNLKIAFDIKTHGQLCAPDCPQLEYVDCDGPGAPRDYYKCRLFGEELGSIPPSKRDELRRCRECLSRGS